MKTREIFLLLTTFLLVCSAIVNANATILECWDGNTTGTKGNYDLTEKGSPVYTASCKVGDCYDMNGAGCFQMSTKFEDIFADSDPFGLCMWASMDGAITDWDRMWGTEAGNGITFPLGTKDVDWRLYEGGYSGAFGTYSSDWQSYCTTYNGSHWVVWENASIVLSWLNAGYVHDEHTDYLTIGGDWKPTSPYWELPINGRLDTITLYSTALEQADVDNYDNSGSGHDCAGLSPNVFGASPEIKLVNISPALGYSENDLVGQCNVTDAENNNVNISYKFSTYINYTGMYYQEDDVSYNDIEINYYFNFTVIEGADNISLWEWEYEIVLGSPVKTNYSLQQCMEVNNTFLQFFHEYISNCPDFEKNVTIYCNGIEIDKVTKGCLGAGLTNIDNGSGIYWNFTENPTLTEIEILDSGTSESSTPIELQKTLLSKNTSQHDLIGFGCTASDAAGGVEWQYSNYLFINNKLPVTQTGIILPSFVTTIDDIVGYCNGTDFDGDGLKYNYSWYRNDGLIKTGTTPSFSDYVMYHNMDDTIDGSSGYENNAIIYGDTFKTTGLIEDAYSFDGDGDYFRIEPKYSLDIINNITISAWIKSRNNTDRKTILSYYQVGVSSTTTGYGLYIKDDKIVFTIGNTTEFDEVVSNNDITTGEWYHIAGVANSSNLCVYINGIQNNCTERTAIAITDRNYYAAIGANIKQVIDAGLYSWYFDGLIDEVRLYNRFLTQDEVTAISHKSEIYQYADTLESTNYMYGDKIIFSCNAYDFIENGNWTNTSALTIVNVPPVTDSSRIVPTTAYTITDLAGYCTGLDVDNDNLKYYYKWYKNDNEIVSDVSELFNITETIFVQNVDVDSSDKQYQNVLQGANPEEAIIVYTRDRNMRFVRCNSETFSCGNVNAVGSTYDTNAISVFPGRNRSYVGYVRAGSHDVNIRAFDFNFTTSTTNQFYGGNGNGVDVEQFRNGDVGIFWGNGDYKLFFTVCDEFLVNCNNYDLNISQLATGYAGNFVGKFLERQDGKLIFAWFHSGVSNLYFAVCNSIGGECTTQQHPIFTDHFNVYLGGDEVSFDEDEIGNMYYINGAGVYKCDSNMENCVLLGDFGSVFSNGHITLLPGNRVIIINRGQVPSTSKELPGYMLCNNRTDILGSCILSHAYDNPDNPPDPLWNFNETNHLSAEAFLENGKIAMSRANEDFDNHLDVFFTNPIIGKSGVDMKASFLNSSNFIKNDEIIFGCNVNDRYTNGSWLNSSTLTIKNSIPIIDYINLTPLQSYTNDTLIGYCNGTDYDGDSIIYNFAWYKNGVEYSTGVTSTQGSLLNISELDSIITEHYNNWSFKCQVNDSQNVSAWSSTLNITILNTPPITLPTNILQTLAYTNTTLIGVCNGTDIDNDSYQFYTEWYVNDILVNSNVTPNNTTLNGTNFVKNDVVIFGCKSTDFTDNGTWVNSTLLIINNAGPQIIASEINPGDVTTINNLIGWCNSTDIDGDNINYNVVWYRDEIQYSSATISTFTQGILSNVNNISYIDTIKGEIWRIECQANDTLIYSNKLNSTGILIKNSVPIVNSVIVTPQYPDYNDNLNCSFNVTEININDEINVTVSWYKGANGIFVPVDAYDYIFENVTSNIIYTTNEITGSVTEQKINYSSWKCEIKVEDDESLAFVNSTQVNLYPLENLTISLPLGNISSKNPLNVTFNVIDYDGSIFCKTQFLQFTTENYLQVGSDGFFSPGQPKENFYDNNWETYALDDSTALPSNIYINYTRQIGNTTGTTWEVKDTVGRVNITFDYMCLQQNPIQFQIESDRVLTTSDWLCYNGTEFISQRSVPGSDRIYGQVLHWIVQNQSNVTSGQNKTLSIRPVQNGRYEWYVQCYSTTETELVTSTIRSFNYDHAEPVISNYNDDSSILFPEIDDTISFNVTVIDNVEVDTCLLYIRTILANPFILENSYPVGLSTTSLQMSYTVTPINNKSNENVSWYIKCNDTVNNVATGLMQNFTVRDVTTPTVQPLGEENFFQEDNLSIISSYVYNGTLNITFMDHNLFQAFINITCETSGQIYYWETLDINTSIYNYNNEVDLTGLPIQKCDVLIGASDDHTKEKIEKYKTTKLNNGYKYQTQEGLIIDIKANTDEKNIKKVSTKKEDDRYTFDFEFKDDALEREFIISSDTIIYGRENSKYPGHVVVWNPDTKRGNWIDFSDSDDIAKVTVETEIEKINDNEVKIKLRPKIPQSEIEYVSRKKLYEKDDVSLSKTNIQNYDELLKKYGNKKYQFKSIGGTNVVNVSYSFWIGGAVHVNSTNIFDNSTIQNITCDIVTVAGYPQVNETQNIAGDEGYFGNLTNGTYNFDCYNDKFFNQQYQVNISDGFGLSNMTYQSYNSILNVVVRNIKSQAILGDVNITVILNETGTGKTITVHENETVAVTFYVNASNYSITAHKASYIDLTVLETVEYRENKTIYMDLGFNATFNFFDELTLLPFNMTNPDKILFLLMCPDETIQTELGNQTSQTLPILCNYNKFRISLFYGTEDYYRTFILTPEQSLNYSIYLIDLYTTTAIINSFQLDDLLDEYENPSIYVKKIINDKQTQITADFIDIENKVAAYLIQNHEYSLEVHSDNLPVRIMGPYAANFEGEKTLSLYDITLQSNPSGLLNDVSFAVESQNTTEGDFFIYGMYEDDGNITSEVKFVVYKDSWGGTLLYEAIVPGDIVIEVAYNATNYRDDTLVAGFISTYEGQEYSMGNVVNDIQTVALELNKYLHAGFMDWFLVLILGMIAIMATIKSGNIVALGIVGMGSLFAIFGWFTLAKGVLALAAIISLMAFLKERGKAP